MVAYDSRRVPDPSRLLEPETIDCLRAALTAQRHAGTRPIDQLSDAIHVAAREARSRSLPPEALLIQLKLLSDEVGMVTPDPDRRDRLHVREWMVRACLRAYWDLPPESQSSNP